MLTARREAAPFTCKTPTGSYTTQYTGGAVTTVSKFSQAYGRFEIRARFPEAKTAGLHSAIWLWPQKLLYDGSSGEIDIAEFRTAWADRVMPHVHYTEAVPGTDMNYTNHNCFIDRPEDFHTYTLDWTRTTLTISYDGKVCIADTWTPAAPLVAHAPFDTRSP